MVVVLLGMAVPSTQERTEFFIQLADPQLGAFTQDRDFKQETANYEFAVANVNRLRPAFVVICGDLINKTGDKAQAAEYVRITSKIDRSIPVYAVAGNHDVGNDPTPETLKAQEEWLRAELDRARVKRAPHRGLSAPFVVSRQI